MRSRRPQTIPCFFQNKLQKPEAGKLCGFSALSLVRQNALKVMMVRVSWMPGIVCTFSLTKWPMSVLSST